MPIARIGQNSMKALLRDVPDLQNLYGFAAHAIRQQVVAVQHQFAGAFEVAAPTDEGVLGEVFGGLPKPRRQGARGVRVILRNEIQNLPQVGERGARPFKFHTL